ncbi:MAG: hypothetical protein ABH873_04125 [Candidatus Firestonebacteria bacterium]
MTIHIHHEDNKCQKCSALFIPFKKDFKCPKCGESTNEFFDFIPELISSMKIHKAMYGSYMPPAWYTGSLVEHIQNIIFELFDTMEQQVSPNPSEFIVNWLNKIEWGDQKYLGKHIEDIALATYQIYESDGKFKDIEYENTKEETKSKGFFKNFLP